MHIILEKAKIYQPSSNNLTPRGFEFNGELGYWNDSKTHEPFILSSYKGPLVSKKFDMETGEDQKGE